MSHPGVMMTGKGLMACSQQDEIIIQAEEIIILFFKNKHSLKTSLYMLIYC